MNIVLFAGTGDGRELAARLCGLPVNLTVCVATEYGHELLVGMPENCHVEVGRRDVAEMRELFAATECGVVVDATHPYAVEVSRNILFASQEAGVPCLRFSRAASVEEQAVYVDSMEDAARALVGTEGNILLATGAKRLTAFTSIPDYAGRAYPRVLPVEESLRECLRLGYRRSHIIAMQGPFGVELNLALMRQFAIRHMVTKDGGVAGGFPEKMRAAREAGVRAVVVGRPGGGGDMSMEEVIKRVSVLMETGT